MPLPRIVRHGDAPDVIKFEGGYAIVTGADNQDVTQALIERYNIHPHLVSLLQRLSDSVEALDGTSVEAEALVDEYRATLAGLGA